MKESQSLHDSDEMEMDPKVSVIIPTKNRAHYLFSAIQSVLRQTFNDFEIIVVDAASIDNTREVVGKFDDKRIRYVRLEKDRGQSASRNIGIRCSRGEFIAFLDDDDLWTPSKLEKQLRIISKNPKIGLVYTGSLLFEGNVKALGYQVPSIKGNVFPHIMKMNYIGTCSSVLIRKECFDKVGLFDENLMGSEDFDLWIRIAKYYEIDYLSELSTLYRFHKKRISIDLDRILKAEKLMFKKYSKELETLRKIRGFWHYRIGALYCNSGNMTEGRKEFIKAINNDPRSVIYHIRLFTYFFGLTIHETLFALASSLLPAYIMFQIGTTDRRTHLYGQLNVVRGNW